MLFWWGHTLAGKKKLGVRFSEKLELVQSYEIVYFMLPLWFSRRIVLYDFSKKAYFELDDGLEKRLLKLGKNATSEQFSKVIKQYEKERKAKINYYETHKEEIENKENEDFVKFLKNIGILFLVILLIILIKWIFF